MADGRLTVVTEVLGLRTGRGDTGSFHDFAHAPLVLAGDAQGSFPLVLKILDQGGLVSGRTVSIDATPLEANAARKRIVRRDNGKSYDDYLKELARAAGMENPTREQLARLGSEAEEERI